jgi:hypothetical protein
MTLQEALHSLEEKLDEFEWIQDPANDNAVRVVGPDCKTFITVEGVNGGDGLNCWLRCSKTGDRLSDRIHLDRPDDLPGAVEKLYCLREMKGDCPLCNLPLGGREMLEAVCSCGYSRAIVKMEEIAV